MFGAPIFHRGCPLRTGRLLLGVQKERGQQQRRPRRFRVTMVVVDTAHEHRLPVAGFEVLTIVFSGELHITAWGDGGATVTFALGGPFRLTSADGATTELDAAAGWADLTPVLGLRHERIADATADGDSNLLVAFDSGRTLSAAPVPQYENWSVYGPSPGDELIAPPGGGPPIRGDVGSAG